jgi:hypothetical protein
MRLLRLTLSLAFVLALVPAATAHAGLLVQTAGPCAGVKTSKVFLRWLDPLNYAPVAGGSFESGSAAWSLSGGATAVAGNESFYVAGARDSRSLSLPSGSSATSPSTCVGLDRPVARLFARNQGSLLSTLRVDVLFEDAGGNVRSLPIAVLLAGASWKPTLPVPIVANLLPLLSGGTPIALRFTPQGAGGKWQIDDVYVDPRARR